MVPQLLELTHSFLSESNLIEGEGEDAFEDSLQAWEQIKDMPRVGVQDVLNLHAVLMRTRTTISPEDRGVWTRYQTNVGGRNNPEPWKVPALMAVWITDINAQVEEYRARVLRGPDMVWTPEMWVKVETEAVEASKKFHVRFEHIHPFLDGNGRVGRILYNWHRRQIGLLPHVITYEERKEYYKWFA